MIYPVVSNQLNSLLQSSFLSRYNIGSSGQNKTPDYQLRPTIGSERARERGGRRGVKSANALPSTYHEDDSEERIVNIGDTIVEEGKSETWSGREGIIVTRETNVEFGKREPNMRV